MKMLMKFGLIWKNIFPELIVFIFSMLKKPFMIVNKTTWPLVLIAPNWKSYGMNVTHSVPFQYALVALWRKFCSFNVAKRPWKFLWGLIKLTLLLLFDDKFCSWIHFLPSTKLIISSSRMKKQQGISRRSTLLLEATTFAVRNNSRNSKRTFTYT